MPTVQPNYQETVNRGLHTLVEMCDAAYTNIMEAHQSINGNEVHQADIDRAIAYCKDMEFFIDYWVNRGKKDYPHSKNLVYVLSDLEEPNLEKIGNLFWYEHLNNWWEIRKNIRESQSRNDGQGFHPDDVARWKSYFVDVNDYFVNFVAKALPVDKPQSTSNATYTLGDVTDYSPGPSGRVSATS